MGKKTINTESQNSVKLLPPLFLVLQPLRNKMILGICWNGWYGCDVPASLFFKNLFKPPVAAKLVF